MERACNLKDSDVHVLEAHRSVIGPTMHTAKEEAEAGPQSKVTDPLVILDGGSAYRVTIFRTQYTTQYTVVL